MTKKFSFLLVVSGILGMFILSSCEKEYVAPPQTVSRSFVEDFDTVTTLYAKGWEFNNNSRPQGTATWRQGLYEVGFFGIVGFPAFSYKASSNEFAYAGFDAGSNISTLSSWMFTPSIEMKNGDKFSFYTRTSSVPAYPDRLQVRMNLTDNTSDVGFDSSSVGKFTTLLSDINPGLTLTGYPSVWTKYEFTVSGLSATLVKRKIAFRYFVRGGGPAGANSDGIGIDKFEFSAQ